MSIHLKNINKSYGKKQVLSDVNLEIKTNAFVMLKGVSGSGKSTLLSIIGGIEPMSAGEVVIDGQDVSSLKGAARADFYRHKVGFIFQGFYLQPQPTIAENIALMGTFAGVPKQERRERAEKLAEDLGIVEVLDRLPAEVSGGQAERACAARALFMNPEIILADEPTNNLDPENAKNVIEMLQKIWQDTNTTMIVASHDPMVEAYASQVISVKEGKVRSEEKTQEAAENVAVTEEIDAAPAAEFAESEA